MLKYFLKSCAVILLSLSLAQYSYGAIDFTGADGDRIILANDNAFNFTGNFTVGAWVYPDGPMPDYAVWICKSGGGTASGFLLREDNANKLQFTFWDTAAAAYTATSTDNITDNTWQYIVGRYDGVNATCFINKVEYKGTGGASKVMKSNAIPVWIGTDEDIITRAVYGPVTDVSIWNETVTNDEIALIVNSKIKGISLQIKPANLVAYFPLDDYPAGTTVTNSTTWMDMTGNGHTGTSTEVTSAGTSTAVGETVLSYPPRPMGN